MDKNTNADYIYAVSRIRAIERKLLDSGKLQQIADAKTAEEALRMILDAGYPAAEDYEQMFTQALDETYALLEELAPQSDLLSALLVTSDYYNLKVLLKAEFLGRDLDYLLNPRCKSGLEAIRRAVLERKGADISDTFDRAMRDARESFARHHNAQMVDMIVDRASYLDMKGYAARTGNEFLIGLVSLQIDLTNIQTLLRLRKIGKDRAFAEQAMLEGGTIDKEALAGLVGEPAEAVLERMSHTAYADLITEVIAQPEGSLQALTKLETLCSQRQMAYIRAAKYEQFGAEPLVAYLLAKQNEIRQLRLIMVGKTNGMENAAIKERLGGSYV